MLTFTLLTFWRRACPRLRRKRLSVISAVICAHNFLALLTSALHEYTKPFVRWVGNSAISLFQGLQNKSQSLSFFVHSIARVGWFTIYQANSKSRVTSQRTQQWVLALTRSHNKLHTIERDNSVYIDLVYRTSRVRVSASLTLTCMLSFSLKKMAKCRLNFAQAFSQRCSFLAVLSECLSVTFKERVYAALLHRSRSSVSLPTQQRI